LSLEAAQSTAAANPQALPQIIGSAIKGLNGAISAARAFIEGAPPLVEIELEQELKSIAIAAEGVGHVKVLLKLDRDALSRIAQHARDDVANIVREAVSNSVRHSAASVVVISLERRLAGVRLRIEDNGAGFDARRARRAGHGLHNMASRARAVGGKLNVKAHSPGGTVVTVDMA
jgi:signal transduction histidine kinase